MKLRSLVLGLTATFAFVVGAYALKPVAEKHRGLARVTEQSQPDNLPKASVTTLRTPESDRLPDAASGSVGLSVTER